VLAAEGSVRLEVNVMQRISIAFVAFPALALAACGDAAPAPAPTSEQSAAQVRVTSEEIQYSLATPLQRRRLVEALGELPLRDDQRTAYDAATAPVRPLYAITHQARLALVDALAAQVSRGQIDRAALQSKIDTLNDRIEVEDSANRAVLASIDGILAPPQRTALRNTLDEMLQSTRGDVADRRAPTSVSASEQRLARNGGDRLLRIMSLLERTVPGLAPEQRAVAVENLRSRLELSPRGAARL
jgi:hypothetical protein